MLPRIEKKNTQQTTICVVPSCNNVYYRPVRPGFNNKHFFRIPSYDVYKRKQWMELLGLADTKRDMRVCQDHFSDINFTSTLRNRLHRYALPEVPVPVVSENVEQLEVFTSQQLVSNESENCDEESLPIDQREQTLEKIHYTIDVNTDHPLDVTGTASSECNNKSAELLKENNLKIKTLSEDKNKKVSCENKVYVYELPSGRKVMYYHLPILENLNKGLN